MICQAETNLCITQSDEKAYNLAFTTAGVAQDITGATVTMTVKRNLSDTTPLVQKVVTAHTNPTDGLSTITLTTADTSIPLGSYYYDIQINGGGISKKTVMKGKLEITWQATES